MYAQRHSSPRWYLKGIGQGLDLLITKDSKPVTPDSGKITIYGPDGTALISDEDVNVMEGGALFSTDNDLTSTLDFESSITESWMMVIDGKTIPFQRDGIVIGVELKPSIDLEDIFSAHPDLRRVEQKLNREGYTLQSSLDRAFNKMLRMFLKKERKPGQILNAWETVDALTALTLHYVFMSQDTGMKEGERLETAGIYEKQWIKEFDTLKFVERAAGSKKAEDSGGDKAVGSRFIEVESDRW